ncbi:MAG: hypothetical protein CMH60_06590 [Myxococcales bacterium]|nr:hypothetical protein [Myxococcales bacterium]
MSLSQQKIPKDFWTFREKIHRAAIPTLGLWLSFVVLRIQMVNDLEFSLEQAFATHIWLGFAYDLLVAAIPIFVAQLFYTFFTVNFVWLWIPSAFLLWLCTLAHTLHMRFFQTPLDWWIVQLHWRDVFVVGDSASDLGLTPLIVVSILGLLGTLYLGWKQFSPIPLDKNWRIRNFRPRRQELYHALSIFLLLAISWQANHWASSHKGGTSISNHIVRSWALQVFRQRMYVSRSIKWADSLNAVKEPTKVLAAYRDFPDANANVKANPWPLVKNVSHEPEKTKAARRNLGLPEEGPIHLLFFFLESFRAYEFQTPSIATEVFPDLSPLVNKYGIQFSQTYSSSYKAGQTVRGQFSTLCSMLPNTLGAATYMAHTLVRVRCLAQLAKENDYQTMWMNSYKSDYHSKKTFEMAHGTDLFFDGNYFRQQGIREKTSKWGLADKPVLEESLQVLIKQSTSSTKPIYANILTISTHHPFTEIPEAKLDRKSALYQQASESYRGYLSTLNYTQEAAAKFIEGIFAAPMGENTLIVLLGDHSTTVMPNEDLTYVQQRELRFRIPMAFLTKHQPNPRIINQPIHQVDIAPTVATIAGLHGQTTWVGNDVLATEQSGSPWVYSYSSEFHYRTGDRACYSRSKKVLGCFTLNGLDPLFEPVLTEIPSDQAQVSFFKDVMQANMQSIALNLIAPPKYQLPAKE